YELLVINRERVFYFALYMQPPRIAIDRRDWKMRSNVERFCRRNKAVHSRERHLQIQRAFAAHDSSVAKFCFLFWHGQETIIWLHPGRHQACRTGLAEPLDRPP